MTRLVQDYLPLEVMLGSGGIENYLLFYVLLCCLNIFTGNLYYFCHYKNKSIEKNLYNIIFFNFTSGNLCLNNFIWNYDMCLRICIPNTHLLLALAASRLGAIWHSKVWPNYSN